MEEESLKNFINSVIFLVKLFVGLKDKFLAQKLYNKISGLIAGYIRLFNLKKGESENVAQYPEFLELKNILDGLLELLDYLEHSKSTTTTPLLFARKNLLNFKLDLIKLYHQPIQSTPKEKENKPTVLISKNVLPKRDREDSSRTDLFVRDSQHAPVSYGIQSKKLRENSNKERIFNFIKRSPNSRTKEIIEEFNVLSERTVKRNLKDLITEGLVRKWAKDNRVYYSVA